MDSSSSSSNPKWIHDVFINFRGEDTRQRFISHLYAALKKARVNAYIDRYLPKGTELGQELSRAIEGSHISIAVFSKRYTKSSWCLNELIKIIECHRDHGQVVVPVFYDVDPSEVRHQNGDFGKYLRDTVKEKYIDSGEERMEYVLSKWRSALTEAANLSGWDVNNCRNEAELVQQIVEDILTKLDIPCSKLLRTFLSITEFPVGLESRVQQIIEFIENKSSQVSIIGIWGMGGSGKTTTAKAIYNRIHRKFVDRSFVENVREVCEKENRGIIHLQEQLLSNILNTKEKIYNIALGTTKIEKIFWGKKALVVTTLCGYEGLSSNVFPSIIWSWMSPTINSLPRISPFRNMSLSLSAANLHNNNLGLLSPMVISLSKIRTVWVQCRSKIQLMQELQRILVSELETSRALQISNLFFRSLLIGMGSCHIVIDTPGESLSQGLTTNDSSDFFLAGGNCPSWLAYKGEGYSAQFQVPEDIDCRVKGIILCVVYSSTSENIGAECLTSVLIINYTKCTIQIHKRDTVISFNDEDWKNVTTNLGPGDDVEIFVAFGHGLIVKETVVYLFYDKSITMEFEQSIIVEVEPSTNMEVKPPEDVKVQPSPVVDVQPSPNMKVEAAVTMEMKPSEEVNVQPSPVMDVQPSPYMKVEAAITMKMKPSDEVNVQPSPVVDVQPSLNMKAEAAITMEMKPSEELNLQPSPNEKVEASITMEVELSTNMEMEPLAEVDVQPSPEMNVQPPPNVTVEASTNVKTHSSAIMKTNPSPNPNRSILTRFAKRIGTWLCFN